MDHLENLLPFLAASALVIAIPGPATFLVVGQAHRSSWRAALATLGIVHGDVILITLSGIGFATVISQWPALLSIIKVAGAAYVAYLGITLILAPGGPSSKPADRAAGTFATGILITVTNPKPILFFAAFFPLFVAADAQSQIGSFFVLGALFEALNLAYFAAIIIAVAYLKKIRVFERLADGMLKRVAGWGLLFCAALILATSLPSPIA